MPTLFATRLGSVIPVTLAILAVTAAGHAQIPCSYEVSAVIQGPWCPIFGFPPTLARSIGENGEVVGSYYPCVIGPREAFLWTPQSGFVTLERPPGYTSAAAEGIDSETGWIVGSMEPQGTNVSTAAVWVDGVPIDLGTLPGGNWSTAAAISSGRIVGKWGNNITGDPGLGAFLWQDGLMINIHADLGTPNSVARRITVGPRGVQVVGWMGHAWFIDSHAYIWHDGMVTDLGVIPGGFTAAASGINSSGTEVVGWGLAEEKGFPAGQTRGFLWREGKMIVIPPLPPFLRSSAANISDDGLVLVNMWGNGGDTALIWLDGVMTDLNDLIPPGLGIHIAYSLEINASGQIVAHGTHPEFGPVGILLTPVNRTLGDLDGDGTVGVLDLLILLANWGPCPDPPDDCPADLDRDGVVGILDLLTLLANWT